MTSKRKTTKITPKDFEQHMRRIEEEYKHDPEAAHYEADGLLCQVLIQLGYERGVGVFLNMKKYYA